MNGWRKNMEDANVILCKDTWGFFGVFDGHGGDQCSKFIAKRLYEELEAGPPADDAAMKSMMLKLDQEFADSKLPSGSTGTFTLVKPPDCPGGKYNIRVGNIGDSRVLLGRADGTIVEGPGTDGGLTTDHKPDWPSERERIERTGGFVQFVQGVARVNGDLAVSRCYGDTQYKQTGGPSQEDHPISAGPEMMTIDCDKSDFLCLVCDGISEGNFPNREVIKLAAEELFGNKDGKLPDAGKAAAAVVKKALATGSYDNLSCMIVLFGGGEAGGAELALETGPYDEPTHGGFKKAYEVMVEHSGLNLAQAIELRYDAAREELKEASLAPRQTLETELKAYGDGPPDSLAAGSEERTKWFTDWLAKHEVEYDPDFASMNQEELIDLCHRKPEYMALARAQGLIAPPQIVRIGEVKEVRAAVKECPSLRWTNALKEACGKYGVVIRVDNADKTAQIKVEELGLVCWLPVSVLDEVEEDDDEDEDFPVDKQRVVKVAGIEALKVAVEESAALQWNERFAEACDQTGTVLRDDPGDGTSKVRFPPPIGFTAWFPSSMLATVEGATVEGSDAASTDADGESETTVASDAGKLAVDIDKADATTDGEKNEPDAKRLRVE